MARKHFARSAKRLSVWVGFQPSFVTMTATGGVLVGSLNAVALALRPFTIVRSRLELFMTSDQSANLETQIACFGCAVVSDQSVAAGVGSLPTPFSDIASDLWFVHKLLFGEESPVSGGPLGPTHSTIDSKAMRKVNNDQDMIIVAEFATGSAGVILGMGGRFLIKLH